jgi:hypothetical protein
MSIQFDSVVPPAALRHLHGQDVRALAARHDCTRSGGAARAAAQAGRTSIIGARKYRERARGARRVSH